MSRPAQVTPDMLDPQLLTEREAAAFLNLSPVTLQHWRSNGTGPAFVKLSNRAIRYLRHDLDAFVSDRTVRPEVTVMT